MAELKEGKSIGVSVDEHRLLERLYPSVGMKKIYNWRKQRYTTESGIEYTRYIGTLDWRCDERFVVDVQRSD